MPPAVQPIRAELTVWNYRCFGDDAPVTLQFGPGAIAIVGTNNSGKSACLRALYDFRSLFSRLVSQASFWSHGSRGQPRPVGIDLPVETVSDPSAMFHYGNERPIRVRLKVEPARTPLSNAMAGVVTEVEITIVRGSANIQLTGIRPGPVDAISSSDLTNKVLVIDGKNYDIQHIIHAAQALANTLFVPSFRNAINVGVNTSYFDIQTGGAFAAQWRNMRQGGVIARNRATKAVEREITALLGFHSLEIVATEDGNGIRLYVNDQPFALDAVGSGVSQLILVLCNAAFRKPSYILIDEPELSLHPSLQIDFLTRLATYAQQGIIFATHSYGLARAAAERIYAVRRDESSSTVTRWEKTHDLAELLGSLNYAGYSQLGFESVLLVEGAKDVLVAHQWLSKYGKGHKVVVLPLGGRSTINGSESIRHQLAEVKRICPKVTALIDSEKNSPHAEIQNDRKGFVTICSSLGIDCHVTERRATENYFPDAVVKRVWGEKYKALGPHESFEALEPRWAKADNWKAADQMTKEQLDRTDLGSIFNSL